MNKLQIKAEILATLRAFSSSQMPDPSLLTDLKLIEDKKLVFNILIKELSNADEHKSLLICWLMSELIEKDILNEYLWNVIKSPEFQDNIKLVAFNMLKDLGSKIDYEVISNYFESFTELINKETKDLLDVAIMNPEAQIDFLDFLNALKEEDKILLLKSLEDDYAGDALANIVIPVFLYYKDTKLGIVALEILSNTKSQLAYHALNNSIKYFEEPFATKISKAITTLKLSGIRVDNTVEFYKNILKESIPFKSYISFPDGHGNMAIIFSRKRTNKTLQFLAVVINPRYGILDAFGFNSMTERDFYKIVDKFYNYQEKYEVNEQFIKHLLLKSYDISYKNKEVIPYEYICWESILLDIEPIAPVLDLEKIELNQKVIDKLCLNDLIQTWFFDEITNPEFKIFIDKLSNEFKNNNYNVDLDKFIADNYDSIFTNEELFYQQIIFKISSYLRLIKNDIELAQIFYSLDTNYMFLTNILRKSIYEYYLSKRYLLKNNKNITNKFEKKLQPKTEEFELLQLDMIISTIEAKWVDNNA